MNFIDEFLLQIQQNHSDPHYVAPNLQDNIPQDNQYTDNGNWLEAAGIGASNMLNNLVTGGTAQIIGTLGRGVEWLSPFSGSQADDRVRLLSMGIPYETALQLYPDQDSWITSGAKGLLEAHNFIDDKINDWRNEAIGDNPSFGTQVAEGVGSSIGFMGAGLLGTALSGNPLAGALWSGLTEAASESGGTLGEAYRQGLYDNGGLAAANKSLVTNALLNSALDASLGMFAPWTKGIRNPISRYAVQTGTNVLNELLQEPSQQIIEKSAVQSLDNGGEFISALGQNLPDWWDTAKQLAPTVASSALITSLLKGGVDMSSAQNRQQFYDEWRNRNVDRETAMSHLMQELTKQQKLQSKVRSEQQTLNNQVLIDDLNKKIQRSDDVITRLQDSLQPYPLQYANNPDYQQFPGNISKVTTRAGANQYNTRFKLMEADDIITSHNDDFSVNPNFPQERQIRDRQNTQSMQEVRRIGDALDPNALADNYLAQNGAPIIGKDNTDLSGNGRVLAIRYAYNHNPEKAQNYRQFIIDNSSQFGVDPDLAARMEKPVLVRVLQDDVDFEKFSTEANSNTIQQLSDGETAKKDIPLLYRDNIMNTYDPAKPLNQQTDFIRAFASQLEPSDRNHFFTDAGEGGISQYGINRIHNAIFAAAYNNNSIIAKLSEAASDISKSVSNALKSLAPAFLKLKATNRARFALDNELEQAILKLDTFRRNPNFSVNDQLQQPNLSGNGVPLDANLELSPEATLLLLFFHQNRHKPNAILQGLANYAQLAMQQSEDGQSVFDENINRSKLDLLTEALGAQSVSQQILNQQVSSPVLQSVTQSQQSQKTQQAQNLQSQNLPRVTALGTNEAYYGNDYYSDRGGDNSNPEQDIPGSHLHDSQQNQTQNYDPYSTEDLDGYDFYTGGGSNTQNTQSLQDSHTNQQDDVPMSNNSDSNAQDVNFRKSVPAALHVQTEHIPIPKGDKTATLRGSEGLSEQQAISTAKSLMPPNFVSRTNPQDNISVKSEHSTPNVQKPLTERIPIPKGEKALTQDLTALSDEEKQHIYEALTGKKLKPDVSRVIPDTQKPGVVHIPIRKKWNIATVRLDFSRKQNNQSTAPSPNNNSPAYDGYIGTLSTGAGQNTEDVHIFFDFQDGNPVVGFTDKNGVFVASYDVRNNHFFIHEGSEHLGVARRIEGEFYSEFGRNPTEELLRRRFVQQAVNAGVDEEVANADSIVYITANKYFAQYSDSSLLDSVLDDNINMQFVADSADGKRGNTSFLAQKNDDYGNIIQEAQSLVQFFRDADRSTPLHETGHIFLNKFRRLAAANRLKGKALLDWGIIKRTYGLTDIDFSKPLSQQDLSLWHNAHENFAASLEKYFWNGVTPKGISAKLSHVFNSFKGWLRDIYSSLGKIRFTNSQGFSQSFHFSRDIRSVFDNMMRGAGASSLENQNQLEATPSFLDSDESYAQSGLDPQGWFSKLVGKAKNLGRSTLHPFINAYHVPTISDNTNIPFPNQKIEQRFMEAMKKAPRPGIIGRLRQTVTDIASSIKGGDYSDITNSPRKNDPQLKLLDALQAFRNLGRAKISAADKAVSVMTDIIKPLKHKQRVILNTYTVIRDIIDQIDDLPGSPLAFGLDEAKSRKLLADLTPLVLNDKSLSEAVKKLDNTRNSQVEDFKKFAHLLGLNMDDVFHYKNYFRRRVIQYTQAARAGKRTPSAIGNLDIQGRYTGELRDIMGHDFFKKRKGSPLDYITDYVQANAEVRAQLAQDIETMKTLLQIRKIHDIAPRLRKQHGLSSPQLEFDFDGTESFSQSGNDEQDSIFNHIPDGYEAFDPSATRLIETAHSAPENLMHMIANDIAEQHGFPVDELLERLGISNEGNIMVIPSEIAQSLRKMAKARHRGTLGQAAKDLTTWWKRSVIFTPIRNLLYNIRNFTGDLDALIAGNPKALRHLPQAVRELTGWFIHHGKDGYEASQDLQDYIRLSGSLGIQSLNLSAHDAQAFLDLIPTPEKTKSGKTFPKRADKEAARLARNTERAQALQAEQEQEQDPGKLKKAWGLSMWAIGKFFQFEHGFTEWREHLLRYATYLEYKNQMENSKDGRPSNWGASIEDEVMSIKDIKERAFKMGNELLGAYDQVSEVGKQLRDTLIPFYSWMEVNMRRTYRLLKNGFKYGYGARQIKQLGSGKFAAMPLYALSAGLSVTKLLTLTTAIQLFNRFVFPDADDELPNDVKYRPHITLGKSNGRTYYFDRIGAIADVLDWASLDSAWLDAKDFANGQKSIGSWFKQIVQAPFSKVINGLNPAIKMPIELAMGRSMFPNAFNPSTIRDPAEYVARSFGLAWPYKAARGIPHSNWQEASKFLVYSQDNDEAAYWQTLDRVRQFQNEVLDKHFDGFASTRRGRILANIKKALRYNDKQAIRRFLREYNEADGTKQGLKSSMMAMNPLHGLNQKEKAQFLKWISDDDKKYLRKAQRYFHQLADRFIR